MSRMALPAGLPAAGDSAVSTGRQSARSHDADSDRPPRAWSSSASALARISFQVGNKCAFTIASPSRGLQVGEADPGAGQQVLHLAPVVAGAARPLGLLGQHPFVQLDLRSPY